jgi:hypothetical protein
VGGPRGHCRACLGPRCQRLTPTPPRPQGREARPVLRQLWRGHRGVCQVRQGPPARALRRAVAAPLAPRAGSTTAAVTGAAGRFIASAGRSGRPAGPFGGVGFAGECGSGSHAPLLARCTPPLHCPSRHSFDRNTGRPRGFGFVCFADPAVVDKVVAQGKHHIDRREVRQQRGGRRGRRCVSAGGGGGSGARGSRCGLARPKSSRGRKGRTQQR